MQDFTDVPSDTNIWGGRGVTHFTLGVIYVSLGCCF